MEYIINGTVKYNSSDGTLFCPDNSIDMITLTHLTSELLLLLMKNNGTPLSRDTILNELWEKRGLSASSNNLNNYVSMLRKALTQCGYPDLITTIPKHGFLFQAEIFAIDENNQTPEISQANYITNSDILFGSEKLAKVIQSKNKPPLGLSWWKIKISMTLFAILVLVLLLSAYDHFRLQSVRTEIFSINKCRVYLTDDITRGMDRDIIIRTIKMISDNQKLKCDNEANIYYFADKKVDSSGHIIMNDLLSYCTYDSKIPCENYYLSKHENEDEIEN
nr:helix-turn-helix domain-containing protein [uncultured Moellerella sp.]